MKVWIAGVVGLAIIWLGGWALALFGIPIGFWTRVLLSLLVLAVVGAVVGIRRYRIVQAARRFEQEILRQSEQHAAFVRPDRRAEILALQSEMQRGIASLRGGKLGIGSGRSALYGLPWYMIIGPPGAGKTTALKESGIEFSFDAAHGGLRGVGGTRNCDWWFSKEAILLDTAGRYTVERDDQEEWFAFLSLLRRFRKNKPINGVIVALSVTELLGAREDQVIELARQLRSRIDELMSRLGMVVPVYLMFTKADLIGGFQETFGDLKKSERDQILGATLPLAAAGFDVGQAIVQEFDQVVQNVHAFSLKRLAEQRNIAARQKILEFPIEFQELRENLQALVAQLFQPNRYQGTPIPRGFYITSGTQEGKPASRVMGRMLAAFGLSDEAPSLTERPVEAKSYFVTNLFQRVIFQDRDIAVQNEGSRRRQYAWRLGISVSSVFLGAILIVPAVITFARNSALVREAELIAASAVQARAGAQAEPLPQAAQRLEGIEKAYRRLQAWEERGPSMGFRWGMFVGDRLLSPMRSLYFYEIERAWVEPLRQTLKDELALKSSSATSSGNIATKFNVADSCRLDEALRAPQISKQEKEQFVRRFDSLKLYLMLHDMSEPGGEEAPSKGRVKRRAKLKADSDEAKQERDWLDARLLHYSQLPAFSGLALTSRIKEYLGGVEAGWVQPKRAPEGVVRAAKEELLKFPQEVRIYDNLAQEARRHTAKVNLDQFIYEARDSLFVNDAQRPNEISGEFTRLGHESMKRLLEQTEESLDRDAWVLSGVDAPPGKMDEGVVERVKALYFRGYAKEWYRFFTNISVRRPKTDAETIEFISFLSEPEWPYLRLIRGLDQHSRVKTGGLELPKGADQLARQHSSKVSSWISSLVPSFKGKGLLDEQVREQVKQGAGELTSGAGPLSKDALLSGYSCMERLFLPVLNFGAPGRLGSSHNPEGLSAYIALLATLQTELIEQRDLPLARRKSPLPAYQAALRGVQAILNDFDPATRQMMEQLLLNPIYREGLTIQPKKL